MKCRESHKKMLIIGLLLTAFCFIILAWYNFISVSFLFSTFLNFGKDTRKNFNSHLAKYFVSWKICTLRITSWKIRFGLWTLPFKSSRSLSLAVIGIKVLFPLLPSKIYDVLRTREEKNEKQAWRSFKEYSCFKYKWYPLYIFHIFQF